MDTSKYTLKEAEANLKACEKPGAENHFKSFRPDMAPTWEAVVELLAKEDAANQLLVTLIETVGECTRRAGKLGDDRSRLRYEMLTQFLAPMRSYIRERA